MKKYLKECKAAYYAGEPIISDSQYDALEEMCSEDLTVGTNKGRFKHMYRLYSLNKEYRGEYVEQQPSAYIETPKLDGAAVAITYIKGWLHSIVTRGNGIYGENVTHLFTEGKCREMGIPCNVPHLFPIQVTGEVVADKTITNARNYAAGALNLKGAETFEEKEVVFFAYDMQETAFFTYEGTLSSLELTGFNTVRNRVVDQYPQDGVVFRQNSNEDYYALGYTSKHPRGAYALKTRSKGVMTILLRVDWETGKSGKVTPVAILDQINIDGAKVARATLNNPGFIKSLDLHIGDAVMVERAGGIIPRIIRKAELEEIRVQAKNSS